MELNIHNVKKIVMKDVVEFKKSEGNSRDFVSKHIFIIDKEGKSFELTLMGETKDDLKVIHSRGAYLSLEDRDVDETLDCELCGKYFRGTDAHPNGTNVCNSCLKKQKEVFK